MTRKDYVLIAAAIARNVRSFGLTYGHAEFDAGYDRALSDVTSTIADALATDNPRFNRELFLAACKLEE